KELSLIASITTHRKKSAAKRYFTA
ncbi:hypothetical protein EVA_18619, partial [gut metagenome]